MQLQLTYPTNGSIIQKFGANPQFYADPKYGGIKGHDGIDFLTNHGWPIYSSVDGFAQHQVDAGGGHGVIVITDKEYEDINGRSSLFKVGNWHLCDGLKEPKFASPFQGKTGFTKVETGDLLGYADNTGASTGDHDHFFLKPCAKGAEWGTYYNLDQDNGFRGSIDPMPYFNGYYQKDIVELKNKVSILQKLIEVWTTLKTLTK